jgi:CBS domain containing-hemolysin-like protein
MIHKIFHLGDTAVKEAMIPLIEVVALPRDATVAEAIAVVGEHRFSRIPIYEERIDHITGIVHAFDLLYADPQMTLEALARPAYYVPEAKRVDDLLREMQRERFQMAIVVDEYGGVVGIATVEDLLEEIVGEIEDEYDEEPPPVRRLPDGSYVVDARVEVDRLHEELGLELPEGEYETVGGFLLHLLEKIPEAGEEVSDEGISFLIVEADERSILKVKIRLPERPLGGRRVP